jgi:transglutaminase-like putative cysteine protease
MVRRVLFLAFFGALSLLPVQAEIPRQRHFKFRYAFTVRNPDPGKSLKVWFPLATTDQWQKVRVLSAKGDLALKRTTEAEYGNRMYYAYTPKADRTLYHFEVVYDVVRMERIGLRDGRPVNAAPRMSRAKLELFLSADNLVPITGRPAELAAEETKGASGALQKAHAIYDYVFRTMRYDKSGTGWGRGDTLWACDAKRGNCTDFHSLFASMARSQGIPVKFSIGFAIPAGKPGGEIPGYHCWADFHADGGWVPVDISEAWKDQSKHEYYFGAHDENRVQFSTGRDLRLNPAQAGEPLNYFIYPYVESDGKKYENVSNDFSFTDTTENRLQAAIQ